MALIDEYKAGLKKAQQNLQKALKSKDKKVNTNFLKHRIKEFKKQIADEQMKKHTDTKSHNINVKIGKNNFDEYKVLVELNQNNAKELNYTATKLNNLEFDIVTIAGYLKLKNLEYRSQWRELYKNRKLQYNALKKYFNTLARFK